MHIQFKSAKNLAFYLSHPSSMTRNTKGKDPVKHADKLLIGANEQGVALFGGRGSQSYERIVPICEFSLIQSGAIAVEATKLIGIVRTFGDNPVSLETVISNPNRKDTEKANYRLVVKSGRSRININEVTDPNEVPRNSVQMNKANSFDFSLKLLKEMMQSVKPSLREDAAHSTMRCLQLKVSGKALSTSTVDGRRLSIAKCELNEKYDEMVALVPAKVVDLILALSAEQDNCSITIGEAAMSITVGSLKFQTALMDVKFPDLNLALPKENLGYAVVQSKPLIEVLERAKIAVDASSNPDSNIPPRIKLNFRCNGTIHCESFNNNILITEEEFKTEQTKVLSGEEISTAFDYTYLQQAISAAKCPIVSLTLAEPQHGKNNDPALIIVSPIDPKKAFNMLALILPHRI
ncbi:hypothetical protein RGL50_004231 [Vibrio alginolyticus]|jgi:DNA polymerase III sliding clamp (beta) subunit (PCNA family)|nr:hypothetical protein [Vibrio alginolyticus]